MVHDGAPMIGDLIVIAHPLQLLHQPHHSVLPLDLLLQQLLHPKLEVWLSSFLTCLELQFLHALILTHSILQETIQCWGISTARKVYVKTLRLHRLIAEHKPISTTLIAN